MADLQKTIRGLECCAAMSGEQCAKCPYAKECEEGGHLFAGAAHLCADALSLLKAQEPRLMTFEEVSGMEWDYCYVEDGVMMDKVARRMFGDQRIHCITWPSIASYKMSYGEAGYGKRWRCWTQRPTDEQRKAAKWDE